MKLDWIKLKRNGGDLYVDTVYIGGSYPQGYDTYNGMYIHVCD